MTEEQSQAQSAAEDSAEAAPPAPSVLAVVADLLARYEHYWVLLGNMARVEWKLSLRCLTLALIMSLLFASLAVIAWVGLWAFAAYGLFNLGIAPWILATGFLIVQLLALVWLWYGVKRMLKTVGFRHTFNAAAQSMPSRQASTSSPAKENEGAQHER